MAYQAKVINATLVSENKQNGFIEIVAELSDRNRCRVTLEKDAQSGGYKPTNVNRLYTVPCGICKKDYQCYCLDRYLDIIATQALEIVGLPKAS